MHATMSTCSTATSAHHVHARRRPGCNHHVVAGCCGGCLERKLRDLEQNWDAYKTSRSTAPPRHRRSRSDSAIGGTPFSAVITGPGPGTPGVLVLSILCGSPRKLLSSVQQAGSGGSGSASASADVTGGDGKSPIRRYEECMEDAASVCSMDAASIAAATVAAPSSCSCSCECTVLCCGCSSSSSCSGSATSTSLFSLREEAVAGEVTKREEGRWAMGSVGRFATIAVIGAAVLGAMAVAVLEFGMDDGYVEFLVPT